MFFILFLLLLQMMFFFLDRILAFKQKELKKKKNEFTIKQRCQYF